MHQPVNHKGYTIKLKDGTQVTVWGDDFRAAMDGSTVSINDVVGIKQITPSEYQDNGSSS